MRIAMITNNYKPFVGGVPVSIEHLSEGLRRRGHEVCIFAPEYGDGGGERQGQWEPEVVRYRSYEKRLKNGMVIPDVFDPRIRKEFAMPKHLEGSFGIRSLKRQEFDLIHVHQPMLAGNLAMYLKAKYQIPIVYTYHTRYEEYLHYLTGKPEVENLRKFLPYYITYFIKRCDLVFAPSTDMKEYLTGLQTDTPIQVLPTGLDDRAYEKDERCSDEIRRHYLNTSQDAEGNVSGNGSLKDRKFIFCTVSRLDQEKNLYFLLRGIRKLKEMLGKHFCVILIGEGAERPALEQYAREMGIADVIAFTGAVPNQKVKDYLFASDAFLFTSKSETQGIVLAEAMAAELPVIAVSACGVKDIVRDGVNGYLTRESEEEFAGCVVRAVSDRNRLKLLKSGARLTAERYRMERIAMQAEQGYQSCKKAEVLGYGEFCKERHTVPSLLRLLKTS